MSQEQLDDFLRRVATDATLQQALKGCNAASASALAQQQGFLVNSFDFRLRGAENSFLQRHCPPGRPQPSQAASLDLGCGDRPRNPFGAGRALGLDLAACPERGIAACDLFREAIPHRDGELDYITAFDFLEHVPRVACTQEATRFPFIELMNEINRVLKEGGLFFSRTPAYPAQEAFMDPTHVNIITDKTIPYYFCLNNGSGNGPLARRYGFEGEFVLLAQERFGCWLMALQARCPKAELERALRSPLPSTSGPQAPEPQPPAGP
jgi:SAM-dependent methyltransferase